VDVFSTMPVAGIRPLWPPSQAQFSSRQSPDSRVHIEKRIGGHTPLGFSRTVVVRHPVLCLGKMDCTVHSLVKSFGDHVPLNNVNHVHSQISRTTQVWCRGCQRYNVGVQVPGWSTLESESWAHTFRGFRYTTPSLEKVHVGGREGVMKAGKPTCESPNGLRGSRPVS
jgi:hypothetical protein